MDSVNPMSQETTRKLQSELRSLQGLTIINMMISALGFAFGALFLIPTLIEIATNLTITVTQVGMVVSGAIVFAVAFRWFFAIINILEVNQELNDKLSEHKKHQTPSDDALTALIVDFTAAYRENKPTLKLMTTASKVACAAFALLATWQLVALAFEGAVGMELWPILLNSAICYGVAAASYLLPHYFSIYSEVWELRLNLTARAEAELQDMLGEA